MIAFPVLSDWFQKEAAAVFSSFVLQRIDALQLSLDQKQTRQILDDLEHYAENGALNYECGPVLTLCAMHDYLLGDLPGAEALYLQSVSIFSKKKDYCKLALVYSMLFHLYCARNDPVKARYYARCAFSSFVHSARTLATEKDRRDGCLYMDSAKEIASDLAANPDAVYEMIHEFNKSEFVPVSRAIVQDINAALNKNEVNVVVQQVSTLIETTRQSLEPKETAEALAYSALIAAKTGSIAQGIKWLRMAVASYLPVSHEQAFSRWLLTLYQFQMNEYYDQALKNVRQCLANIEHLQVTADEAHNPYQRLWYECMLFGMRKAAENMMRHRRIAAEVPPPAPLTPLPRAEIINPPPVELAPNGHGNSVQVNVSVTVNLKPPGKTAAC